MANRYRQITYMTREVPVQVPLLWKLLHRHQALIRPTRMHCWGPFCAESLTQFFWGFRGWEPRCSPYVPYVLRRCWAPRLHVCNEASQWMTCCVNRPVISWHVATGTAVPPVKIRSKVSKAIYDIINTPLNTPFTASNVFTRTCVIQLLVFPLWDWNLHPGL